MQLILVSNYELDANHFDYAIHGCDANLCYCLARRPNTQFVMSVRALYKPGMMDLYCVD